MRLGGPVFDQFSSPAEWVAAVRKLGYRAAYCPVGIDAPVETVRAYAAAAEEADIVIAEVGAWSNPLSPDADERAAALDKCKCALALADAIGARCCVNIAGSRGPKWDGPCALDHAPDTFDLIVATVRDIIDSVEPQRTYYTLEPMPWLLPDSVEAYAALIRAIDRPRFGVHFDPVNLVNSPARYFGHTALIDAFVEALGPQIRSVHVKDMVLHDTLTVHLEEVRPGLGTLDYPAMLRTLAQLDPDLPLLVEHLPNEAEYTAAVAYVRAEAMRAGFGAELGAAGRG